MPMHRAEKKGTQDEHIERSQHELKFRFLSRSSTHTWVESLLVRPQFVNRARKGTSLSTTVQAVKESRRQAGIRTRTQSGWRVTTFSHRSHDIRLSKSIERRIETGPVAVLCSATWRYSSLRCFCYLHLTDTSRFSGTNSNLSSNPTLSAIKSLFSSQLQEESRILASLAAFSQILLRNLNRRLSAVRWHLLIYPAFSPLKGARLEFAGEI